MKSFESKRNGSVQTAAVVAALLLATKAAFAVSPTTSEPTGESDPMFQRLDANNDGFVTRQEATREPGFMKAFNEADDDGDNRLSSEEFIKAHSVHNRQELAQIGRDALITAKVKVALLRDPIVEGLEVDVDTNEGVVLLSGQIADPEMIARAVSLASQVDGVVEVREEFVRTR